MKIRRRDTFHESKENGFRFFDCVKHQYITICQYRIYIYWKNCDYFQEKD